MIIMLVSSFISASKYSENARIVKIPDKITQKASLKLKNSTPNKNKTVKTGNARIALKTGNAR